MTGASPLNLLAIGPLPYVREEVRSLDFGVSVFNAEMLPALAHRGHRVRVIEETRTAAREAGGNSFGDGIANFALEPVALEFRSGSKPPARADLEKTRAQLEPIFERMVAQQRPDVVIAGRESLAWYLADLCERHRLPILMISHGSPTAALRSGVYPKPLMEEFIAHLRRMTSIVTVAQHLAEVLHSFGLSNVRVIPNAADIESFRPAPKSGRLLAELGIDLEQPVIAHVSTFASSKRLDDVIASAEIVLRSAPRVVYLVIGEGPDRGAMEQVCRDKRIDGIFRFVGIVEHRRMPEYLNLADLLIHPSHAEGCPFIYRETQACGRVLLASDIPAAHEAIVDGETGVLFHVSDTADLAAKTLSLVGDPARRSRIGGRAREAAEQWSREHWVDEYIDVLRRTLFIDG